MKKMLFLTTLITIGLAASELHADQICKSVLNKGKLVLIEDSTLTKIVGNGLVFGVLVDEMMRSYRACKLIPAEQQAKLKGDLQQIEDTRQSELSTVYNLGQ